MISNINVIINRTVGCQLKVIAVKSVFSFLVVE